MSVPIPAILMNPKFWILFNMGTEALFTKLYSQVEGMSDEEMDALIIKNRVEIDAAMEEMRNK